MASEIFQYEMENILSDLEGVTNTQDDVIIWGSNKLQHDERLTAVLQRIKDSGLKLNKRKCQIGREELTFLGHKISKDGIGADPKKVEAILKMNDPTNKTELQRFLGMVNYIGKFVPNLADLTAPLRMLLEKDVEFEFVDIHREAVKKIKLMITSTPILKIFQGDRETKISSDASKDGLGAVLLQKYNKHWFPVAYASTTP